MERVREIFPIFIINKECLTIFFNIVIEIFETSKDKIIEIVNDQPQGQIFYQVYPQEFGVWIELFIPVDMMKDASLNNLTNLAVEINKRSGIELVISSVSLLTSEWVYINRNTECFLVYETEQSDEHIGKFELDFDNKKRIMEDSPC